MRLRLAPGLRAREFLVSVFALAFGLAACRAESAAEVPVRVAAAADLVSAFEELGRAFFDHAGQTVTFSFGSSGLLASQVAAGAPFDVFAAANRAFVEDLVRAGACDGRTQALYGRGRIALWVKKGAVAPPGRLQDLAEPRFRRVAIANPKHAPYGQAARQALEHVNVYKDLEPRLVLGENVRQALQFAETGNVEAAIVAVSLVNDDRHNPWMLIDESLHRPIDQALVVCTPGNNRRGGEAFVELVNSERGRVVMRRYGFVLPGERLVQAP